VCQWRMVNVEVLQERGPGQNVTYSHSVRIAFAGCIKQLSERE